MSERTIQGRHVRFDPLPADLSLKLMLRILRVMRPATPIFRAVMCRMDEGGAQDVDVDFAALLDDDDVAELLRELVAECRVDGSPAVPGVMEPAELVETALFAAAVEYRRIMRPWNEAAGMSFTRARRR